MKFREAYETHREEYGKFERITEKFSSRPDIHAFILLNQLVPGSENIVSGATHDEFFLDVDPEKLGEVASEAQMIDLIRCRVRYSRETDSLSMFA